MSNTIGIVIATYNGEKYIEEQINSIINQTLKPDLIIISDGGSKDNTIELSKKILSNSNIEYQILVSDKQLSVKDNFEKGIRKCDTDIVFCADQDDYWLPTKIIDFLEAFENNDAAMVFSNAYIVDEKLGKTGKTLWEAIGFYVNKDQLIFERADRNFLDELNRHNVVTGMCMAFKGMYKDELLPFSNYSIHDVWITYRMNQLGKIVALNKPEVLYRQHGNNVIGVQKSVKRSMKNRNTYYERVIFRIKFIEDILEKCKDNKLLCDYNNYLLYLNRRRNFLTKKTTFFNVFFDLISYKKYEYKWKEIILKDIYTRWSMKDK